RTVAEAAAREAGALIRRHVDGPLDAVRDKGLHDLVTEVDEAAERLILARLRAAFPDDAVLAEESAEGESAEGESAEGAMAARPGRCWIVDPLDGTTNFAHGVPPYAVSIALQEDGEGVVGVVYDVPHDELFVAVRGRGLTLNGRPARVSGTAALGEGLAATGFPFRDYRSVGGYLATFEQLIRRTRGVRRHGAASVDLAWVACGRFDGFVEAGLAPWDTAAGVVLVREGGGTGAGPPAGAGPECGGGIVASNGRIHAALAEAAGPLGEAYGAR